MLNDICKAMMSSVISTVKDIFLNANIVTASLPIVSFILNQIDNGTVPAQTISLQGTHKGFATKFHKLLCFQVGSP